MNNLEVLYWELSYPDIETPPPPAPEPEPEPEPGSIRIFFHATEEE